MLMVTSVLPNTSTISNVLVCIVVCIHHCHDDHHGDDDDDDYHKDNDDQGGSLVTALPVLLTAAIALHVLCRSSSS